MIKKIAAGAALAALAKLGYASMTPKSQLFGRTFIRGDNSRYLALTYDDGPNDAWTPPLLEVLSCHGVRATFFLIGKFVRQHPEIVRSIHAAGHAIGNHTYNHPNLVFALPGEVKREISDTQSAIEAALGASLPEPLLFRPPFGGRRPDVLLTVREMGFTTVMWSVTCWDWKPTSAEAVENHAVKQILSGSRSSPAKGGEVILLHDGGHVAMGADRSHTIAATDRLIRRYREEGRTFVTIPEMMARADEIGNGLSVQVSS